MLAVALVGTTITPYIQLYTAGRRGRPGHRSRRVPGPSGSTPSAAAVVASLVAMSILIATAAAIGGTGALSSGADAAKALEPVAGRFATELFGIGLLGASALAAAVVPLSTSYAVAEAIGVERSVSSTFRQAPLFLGLFTAQLLIGALVVLGPGNLFTLIINTQVLEGVVTPITLAFLLVLANRRRLLGDAANGRLARTVGLITVVAVGAFAIILVGLTVAGWLGIST